MSRLLQTYTLGPFERVERYETSYCGPFLSAFCRRPGYKVEYYIFGFRLWTSRWRPLP